MAQGAEVNLFKVVVERRLEIADYQRPYAWEAKQLTDLWEDLDLLGSGVHYAGTLVLKKDVDAPDLMTISGETLALYEVVDGQQRLTTCLLLLDRVRRRLAPLGAAGIESALEAAKRLGDTYGLLLVDGVKIPRLRLGEDLNGYWLNSILGDYPIAATTLVTGEQRLKAAAEFYDRRIDGLIDGASEHSATSMLQDLQRRVTNGLRFLVYEVHSETEVGIIFETLNERGRPLTELEKVKNYLLYLARQLLKAPQDDLRNYINHEWSDIFVRLSKLPTWQEERLLRAHWLATYNADSRQWHGIESVKKRFPRSKYVAGSARLGHSPEAVDADQLREQLYADVKEYVRTLSACATYLAEMYDPTAGYHAFTSGRDRTKRATDALLRSPAVALFQPLIFAFRLAHPTDGDTYADLIALCETYSARVFAICQRRGGAGEPYLCRIAMQMFQGANVGDCLARISALLWEYATDDEVQKHLTGHQNWYLRQSHKYVLYEYERYLAKSDSDVIAWSEINDAGSRKTTEHILPQNPAEGSDWWKAFSDKEHAELRHTLGNLVLTYDNSVYSNKEYADKLGTAVQTTPKCYHSSTLRQELEIAKHYPQWTPETIGHRQYRIADWAMKRWHVAAPAVASALLADEAVEQEAESIQPTPDHIDADGHPEDTISHQ